MRSQTKDIIIVEWNEFNDELLKEAATQLHLPALKKILEMKRTEYRTEDRYNSGFLEPWVQWVSVHSAMPSKYHQVKHLGDVPDLQFEQFWQVLSRHHISTGIWGVMNGAKRDAKEVKFFLPDPWTFSEQAYPPELNRLLQLPRYVSKNYQALSKPKLFADGIKLIYCLLTSGIFGKMSKEIIQLVKDFKQYGNQHFIYIAFFEFISFLLFTKYKMQLKPQVSILFLNTLAHLQHHYWNAKKMSPELTYGFKMFDRLFTLLFAEFPNDAIVIHNGLSQMNTNHEKPWVLYRQKNPAAFLQALHIPATQVEAHMTHDAHLFFATPEDCQKAYDQLKSATILGNRLFHVEKNTYNPCKLFYHLHFTDELESNAQVDFQIDGKTYSFFAHFDRIVKRTGRHIPIGTIYSNDIVFKDFIFNHDFNRYIFHYLMPNEFTLNEKAPALSDIELETEPA